MSNKRKKYEYDVVVVAAFNSAGSEADWLNEQAQQGWRLVAMHNARHYFEREVEEETNWDNILFK